MRSRIDYSLTKSSLARCSSLDRRKKIVDDFNKRYEDNFLIEMERDAAYMEKKFGYASGEITKVRRERYRLGYAFCCPPTFDIE